jgi:hypothetical protein
MLDKDMREPLFDYLDTEFGKVRTIEEKIIKKSRADVLAITDGAIIGIEIKSDADTYSRLATQVKDYDKYCDYCYIAVGESHRLHAAEHVPDHWGVLVISPDGEVRELREAKLNKKVKLKTQLDLLWRPELLGIQMKYGYPKYANKKRSEIYDYLIEHLGEEQLRLDMTDQLFERDYTVFDIPALRKTYAKAEKKKKSGSGILAEKSLLHVSHYVGKRGSGRRKRRRSK